MATLVSACGAERDASTPALPRPCTSACEIGCSTGDGSKRCPDLPPLPQLAFQLHEPRDAADYPYGPELAASQAARPGTRVYLSAHGSRDPEGGSITTFWNVQDQSGRYLPLDPAPTALRASFAPSRPGVHSVTLQVTERSGLRQTGQLQMSLTVAPQPCAEDGVSPPCSDELEVPGGTFFMGSADDTAHESERPRHPAIVAPFLLDRYEVTVGRFRRYLERYAPANIQEGAAAHPRIPSSGWRVEWLDTLPSSADNYRFAISECGGVWTDDPDFNEARPIGCITWFEAFAFCASEGKRLPTEAEWEYAAAGGDEQRLYPWGSDPPSVELAVFGCSFDGEPSCTEGDLPVAGSVPRGVARFGHLDLSGSLWEWTLDAYAAYDASVCENCAVLGERETPRVFRGGDFKFEDPASLRAITRYAFNPAFPDPTRGLRCARSVVP